MPGHFAGHVCADRVKSAWHLSASSLCLINIAMTWRIGCYSVPWLRSENNPAWFGMNILRVSQIAGEAQNGIAC